MPPKNGTELNETLPKLSPLNPQYKNEKNRQFSRKIVSFIEKFKGVGGKNIAQFVFFSCGFLIKPARDRGVPNG
ncbi:hypothetical protein ACP0HM_30665 [Escherichia coli]